MHRVHPSAGPMGYPPTYIDMTSLVSYRSRYGILFPLLLKQAMDAYNPNDTNTLLNIYLAICHGPRWFTLFLNFNHQLATSPLIALCRLLVRVELLQQNASGLSLFENLSHRHDLDRRLKGFNRMESIGLLSPDSMAFAHTLLLHDHPDLLTRSLVRLNNAHKLTRSSLAPILNKLPHSPSLSAAVNALCETEVDALSESQLSTLCLSQNPRLWSTILTTTRSLLVVNPEWPPILEWLESQRLFTDETHMLLIQSLEDSVAHTAFLLMPTLRTLFLLRIVSFDNVQRILTSDKLNVINPILSSFTQIPKPHTLSVHTAQQLFDTITTNMPLTHLLCFSHCMDLLQSKPLQSLFHEENLDVIQQQLSTDGPPECIGHVLFVLKKSTLSQPNAQQTTFHALLQARDGLFSDEQLALWQQLPSACLTDAWFNLLFRIASAPNAEQPINNFLLRTLTNSTKNAARLSAFTSPPNSHTDFPARDETCPRERSYDTRTFF